MSFKSSSNEPMRLLSGLAACGRLPNREKLLKDEENPCIAKPYSFDIDQKEILRLASDRRRDEFRDHIAYAICSAAILFVAGFDLGPLFWVVIAIATYISYRRLARDKYILAENYSAENFDSDDKKMNDEKPKHNLVTYSGDNPFSDFGTNVGSWVLAVDTRRPKSGHDGPSIIDHKPSPAEIERLIAENLSQSRLLRGEARVLYFMHGSQIPKEVKAPGPYSPPKLLSKEQSAIFNHDPSSPVRRYLWFQKRGWSKEISLSYFVRISSYGADLILEISAVFMPPISKRYRWIDEIPPRSFKQTFRDIVSSSVIGGVSIFMSPLFLLGESIEAIKSAFSSRQDRIKRKVASTPSFNFGAPLGLRRKVADFDALSHFQQMDRRAGETVFSGRILRVFIDYLDECGVDTSELRNQQTTLLNQGIIVQGGDVKATNIAAGAGAAVTALAQSVTGQKKAA